MQMDLADMDKEVGDESEGGGRVRKQYFPPQQIRGNRRDQSDRDGPGRTGPGGNPKLKPPPRNDDYVFEVQEYALQGVVPKSLVLDARVVEDMKHVALPFPMKKLCDDDEVGEDGEPVGAWYVFGTKLIYVSELDDDVLQVREYKSHGDVMFSSYISAEVQP